MTTFQPRLVEALGCFVIRLEYDFTLRKGRLRLPSGEWSNMDKTIALFTQIDPDCLQIWVFRGGRASAVYRRGKGSKGPWKEMQFEHRLDHSELRRLHAD